ncbi:MAG: membrane protein insertase YidC [Gemmatimonadales bacterium]|nr:membrane protein insertase YidC [Gemmatimonadales bacterium]
MDRRVLTAIVLMLAVAILPAVFSRPKPGSSVGQVVGRSDSPVVAPPAPGVGQAVTPPVGAISVRPSDDPAALIEDTVVVSSPAYRYAFSTRGGRMVEATMQTYRSMRREDQGGAAQLLSPESELLGLALLVGRDTISLRDWVFTPTASTLDVAGAPAALGFTAERGGVSVALTYTFRPDSYLIDVTGSVRGLGPEGATLLVRMGPGLRNTESDSVEHLRELGVVVKSDKATLTRYSSLDLHESRAFDGPFEWVAVKSKYFVTALLALDTTGSGLNGRISGVHAIATDTAQKTTSGAAISAGLPVPATGQIGYQLYAGPLEYPRLRAIGHDFDDVNPYGWPGFRTIIRPVALGARSMLVWMHDSLGLAYGMGLVMFGILIRILLWPLNQKAMRSTMAMQAIQPLMKEIQERYKSDPQKQQQEMFKLYKEHNVNPFGGCWPMLLPWPILLAFFFVFQNTIELRGASFLWLPDLSRPDPLYIIPVLMAASMYVLSKLGQLGMAPNPQMKMMLYMMPVMMLILFANFASGLNLYYTVMNLASLPQQWMLSKERMRRMPPTPAPTPAPKSKK